MSETETCSLAEAFWKEFGGLEWRVSHRRLPSNFLDLAMAIYFQLKLSANIPLTHKDVGLALPHPVLAIGDFIKCLDSNGQVELAFHGQYPKTIYSKDVLAYVARCKERQSLHPIYAVHSFTCGPVRACNDAC